METKIQKEVRVLKIYTLISTIIFLFLLITSFTSQNSIQKFEEFDVERIKIVEKDGSLKMAISNRERKQPEIVNEKVIKDAYQWTSGIIFNQIGDEMGGLVYGVNLVI